MTTTPAPTPFEDYTEEFQLEILRLMYADPDFSSLIAGSVTADHFDLKIHSVYAALFLAYAKRYPGKAITREVIYVELSHLIKKKLITDEEKGEYIKVLAEIIKPPTTPEYVRDEIKDFVVSKSLEVELVNSVDLLQKKKFTEIFERIDAVQTKLTGGKAIEDFSLVGGIDSRVAIYSSPDYLDRKGGTSTSVAGMDANLYQKGIGKKEMMVFCGSPGRGKSICLVNVALIGMLNGKKVLFYTLEVSQEIVLARMDACITGIPFVELGRYPHEVAARWNQVKDAFPHIGELKLLDLPPRWLSPNKIKQHIRQYDSRGWHPDIVIVDYADIMTSDRRIDERRLEHGDVYESLRGVAKEFDVPVITASQANRDSLRKKDVDIDSMSEDFSKAMTADYVIGLSQDKREEEERLPDGRGTGTMRWFIGKNRNGKKGVNVPMMTDYTRMRVSIDDWTRFDLAAYGSPSYRLPLKAA